MAKREVGRRANPQVDRLGSKEVFSYHSSGRSGSGATTRRFDQFREVPKRRRVRLRWHQLPMLLASFAIVACLIYISTLTGNPKVVVASGQQRNLLREKKDYETAAAEIIGSSILNKSKITVNTQQFSKAMRQRFPELSTVVLTVPLMDRHPVVEIVPAQPVMSITSQNGAFLLDKTGRALVSSKEAKDIGSWDVPQVIDESAVDHQVGQGSLPEQTVTFITTFVAQLQAKDLKVSELKLPPRASELQVKLEGVDYFIKASTRSDVRLAAGTFLALKDKLDRDKITPKEYIDVRVEEKVYFK